MKRVDLIRAIETSGCVLVRHGARHDWFRNPITGVSQPVPRHRAGNPGREAILRSTAAGSAEAELSAGGTTG